MIQKAVAMTIQNVAIAGATGNIGSAIIKALAGSNKFDVTALTRSGSTSTSSLPSNVKSVSVDYEDPSTLVKALKGQDAVVSALNHAYLAQQRALLDASIEAGVQRFIPSEFGSDTLNAKAAPLPVFHHKQVAKKYLEEVAAEGKITYTFVVNGPFLDWGLNNGFLGLDLKKKQMTYVDGGVTQFSTSTLATVGQAVVGVLTHPQETANRAVYVQDTLVTLRDLQRMAKQVLGDDDWTEIDGGQTAENEKACYEKLAQGQKDMGVFLGFLLSAIYREGYGGKFEKLDNELLGIKGLSESEIVDVIKGITEEQSASA